MMGFRFYTKFTQHCTDSDPFQLLVETKLHRHISNARVANLKFRRLFGKQKALNYSRSAQTNFDDQDKTWSDVKLDKYCEGTIQIQ